MSNITDKPWLVPGHMYQYDIGWLVEKLLSFETELNTAIDLKTIHYADPIQWDITTQYSPNTVVVDPKTGTAYMSKVAVPAGILLTNTDYWVVIFNYQRIYDKIMSGVAFNDKDNLNATKDLAVNDLVWYGGDLYRATRAIPEGTKYIPGTNLVATTIADCLATYYGRDRVAQVLNDTLNVSGDYTINAGDISRTASNITDHATKDYLIDADGKYSATIAGNREINVGGNDSIHVDGVTSINRGGAVTEVYGASKGVTVNGDDIAIYKGAVQRTLEGKTTVTGKDIAVNADSVIFNVPHKQVDMDRLPFSYVDVRDFGAVGNAHYYDIDANAFYTDATKATRPTSDVQAVNDAIEYAIAKGFHAVYFPDGDYYLPGWSYTLDTSKLAFVGSSHAALCSESITTRAFITLTSTVDLGEYTYARCPLENISIRGNYFTGRTDENEDGIAAIDYGVLGNSDATLISPHISLSNVTVQGFSCGLRIGTAYKSTLYNFSAIACNYGIYITDKGYAQAVPLNIYNVNIECCNHAIWCLAPRYTEIILHGGAIEYCRQNVASNADIVCIGVRFEGDLLSCMDVTSNAPLPVFNITGGCLHLISCFALFLPNYADNVKFWNPNTAKLPEYNQAAFSISTTAIPGLYAEDFELATDQWTSTSTYFISSGSANLAIYNSHLGGGIAAKKNVISPSGKLVSSYGFYGHTDS